MTIKNLYRTIYPYVEDELVRLGSLDAGANIYPYTLSQKAPKNPFQTDSIIELSTQIANKLAYTFRNTGDFTGEVLASNTAFHVQHLLRDPNKKLRIFDPHDKKNGIVSVTPNATLPIPGIKGQLLHFFADISEKMPFFREHLSHAKLDIFLWRAFVVNLEEILHIFTEFQKQLSGLGEKNILVVTNHITWANIPFLAFCFHYFLGIPKEKIFAIVGPAIFTSHSEYNMARRSMGLILTWPDTLRGNTGYEKIGDIRWRAMRNTLKIINESSGGKVIFVAPSGTSDEMIHGMCHMHTPSKTSATMIRELGKKENMLIVPVGVNDSEIMRGNKPNIGNVYVRIGEILRRGAAGEGALEMLPKLVLNSAGESIGIWKNGSKPRSSGQNVVPMVQNPIGAPVGQASDLLYGT